MLNMFNECMFRIVSTRFHHVLSSYHSVPFPFHLMSAPLIPQLLSSTVPSALTALSVKRNHTFSDRLSSPPSLPTKRAACQPFIICNGVWLPKPAPNVPAWTLVSLTIAGHSGSVMTTGWVTFWPHKVKDITTGRTKFHFPLLHSKYLTQIIWIIISTVQMTKCFCKLNEQEKKT